MEDHVRRNAVRPGARLPPLLQPRQHRPAGLGQADLRGGGAPGGGRRPYAELVQERAGLGLGVGRPGEEEVRPRARDADVEQPALLVGLGLGPTRTERQLPVEQPWEEHRVELQAFRAVVRQQVDPSAAVLRGEPPAQLVDERRHRRRDRGPDRTPQPWRGGGPGPPVA